MNFPEVQDKKQEGNRPLDLPFCAFDPFKIEKLHIFVLKGIVSFISLLHCLSVPGSEYGVGENERVFPRCQTSKKQ